MTQESDCVLCGIVHDPSSSDVVYEDESVLAFMGINPVTYGHVLVIPKDHSVGLVDIPPGIAGHMMTVAQRIAQAIMDSDLRSEGVNLFFAEGEEAFQEVFHSHLHVFPRSRGDGFTIGADWNGRTKEPLTASAAEIRDALPQESA